ncbi:MAG: methionyl-tRNA formyltransferase [Burkholderiaceae bacterium]|nr:methionyl-tRNA formyltransferase [Burkholderiaceae bacterium]
MNARSILLVGADTARARAYAGVLSKLEGIEVRGLIYGGPQDSRTVPDAPVGWPPGLAVPAIETPVTACFARHGWPILRLDEEPTINAPAVVAAMAAADAGLAIFCGRGGEIVSADALSAAPPMLHCHPGRLPDERGSTTLYYSLLGDRRCAVSALLLAPEIDAGPVLATREYPRPGAGCDLDVLYDCAIRADMLLRMVRRYLADGELTGVASDAHGELYFVIHPVLKHLALLSLRAAESGSSEDA